MYHSVSNMLPCLILPTANTQSNSHMSINGWSNRFSYSVQRRQEEAWKNHRSDSILLELLQEKVVKLTKRVASLQGGVPPPPPGTGSATIPSTAAVDPDAPLVKTLETRVVELEGLVGELRQVTGGPGGGATQSPPEGKRSSALLNAIATGRNARSGGPDGGTAEAQPQRTGMPEHLEAITTGRKLRSVGPEKPKEDDSSGNKPSAAQLRGFKFTRSNSATIKKPTEQKIKNGDLVTQLMVRRQGIDRDDELSDTEWGDDDDVPTSVPTSGTFLEHHIARLIHLERQVHTLERFGYRV